MVCFVGYVYQLYMCLNYRIAGNFHRVQFSRMINLYHFAGLIFADVRTHNHFVLYNQAYFMVLIFTIRRSSVKTVTPRKFPAIQYAGHVLSAHVQYYCTGIKVVNKYMLPLQQLSSLALHCADRCSVHEVCVLESASFFCHP